MTGKLDKIEAKLKAFFEKSARLAPQHQQQLHIAEQLVASMRKAVESGQDGALTAPGTYELRMHPEVLGEWETQPHLLDDLTRALQEAARESGVRFQTPLMLHLIEDETVNPDTVKIALGKPPSRVEETANMTLEDGGSKLSPDTRRQFNAFLLLKDRQAIPLTEPVINLGRMLDNQIPIEDPRVSRRHAQLRIMQNRYMIIDLDSTGGTYVNGQRIQKAALKPGDVISLAGVPLIYGEDNPAPASIAKTGTMLTARPDQPTVRPKGDNK